VKLAFGDKFSAPEADAKGWLVAVQANGVLFEVARSCGGTPRLNLHL
jgi:hypothetical protein